MGLRGGVMGNTKDLAHRMEREIAEIHKRKADALDSAADKVLAALKEYGFIRSTEKIAPIKPGHGPCCTCQTCGQDYDDCVCETNQIIDLVHKALEEE